MSYIYKLLISAVCIYALSGCASKEYIYTPPDSDAGVECIMQCKSQQSRCKEIERLDRQDKRDICLQRADDDFYECKDSVRYLYRECKNESNLDYISCLKYSNNPDLCKQKKCKKSQKRCVRSKCHISTNFATCNRDYRACYRECGGEVTGVD